MTTKVVRKFARRARGYTCAYYALAFGANKNEAQGENISPTLIECMIQNFKTHRCALDFEGRYIVKMMKDREASCNDLPVVL